jgi:outer membrane receptor protein involved in Fe transport
LLASGTFLKAELGSGAGADIGSWLNGVPAVIGNFSADYTVGQLKLLGDFHFVGRRYTDFATNTVLPKYAYLNLGASYTLPGPQLTVSADILNAFQSKGLEEGNPRLTLVGGRTSDIFLARPLLPRRLMLSLRHDF